MPQPSSNELTKALPVYYNLPSQQITITLEKDFPTNPMTIVKGTLINKPVAPIAFSRSNTSQIQQKQPKITSAMQQYGIMMKNKLNHNNYLLNQIRANLNQISSQQTCSKKTCTTTACCRCHKLIDKTNISKSEVPNNNGEYSNIDNHSQTSPPIKHLSYVMFSDLSKPKKIIAQARAVTPDRIFKDKVKYLAQGGGGFSLTQHKIAQKEKLSKLSHESPPYQNAAIQQPPQHIINIDTVELIQVPALSQNSAHHVDNHNESSLNQSAHARKKNVSISEISMYNQSEASQNINEQFQLLTSAKGVTDHYNPYQALLQRPQTSFNATPPSSKLPQNTLQFAQTVRQNQSPLRTEASVRTQKGSNPRFRKDKSESPNVRDPQFVIKPVNFKLFYNHDINTKLGRIKGSRPKSAMNQGGFPQNFSKYVRQLQDKRNQKNISFQQALPSQKLKNSFRSLSRGNASTINTTTGQGFYNTTQPSDNKILFNVAMNPNEPQFFIKQIKMIEQQIKNINNTTSRNSKLRKAASNTTYKRPLANPLHSEELKAPNIEDILRNQSDQKGYMPIAIPFALNANDHEDNYTITHHGLRPIHVNNNYSEIFLSSAKETNQRNSINAVPQLKLESISNKREESSQKSSIFIN